MSRGGTVVIGVGNPLRHDDGIGPVVAAAIAARKLPGVRVVTCAGDPASLLDTWRDARLAVVVDALRTAPPAPGRLHRLTAGQLAGGYATASSHGFGVPAAFGLARALGQLPGRLIVIAVEAACTGPGAGLSPPVRGAVSAAVEAVLAEVRT